MVTEPMKHAHFDHPKHGSYKDPEAVLKDDRLSAADKEAVLKEWSSSLEHILRNEPDAPQVKSTKESLDTAMGDLAAGRI